MSNELDYAVPAAAFAIFEAAQLTPPVDFKAALPLPLNTAEELLHWVLGDPLRNKHQKNNDAAAVKWLGRTDGTPLSAIPLEVRYLVDDRIQKIRQNKDLTKRRRSNIVTLLNGVLIRARILAVGSRRAGATSHQWETLIGSMDDHDARNALSTLGKYCSARKIEPADVTLNVWASFADETLHHSTFKKPRQTLQKTLRASNVARATVPGWPLLEFPPLINPRLVSIPKGDLPSSFWNDIHAYMVKSRTPAKDIFDTTWPKQLSQDTLNRYREVAWRTASAQVHEGRDPAEIIDLAALLELVWLKKAMSWFYHHAGDTFLKDHLNMAAAWVSFARNYVHPQTDHFDELRNIFKTIEKKLGPPEFSQKNVEKLEQFSTSETVDEFLFLPYQIMAEIKKKKVITVEDATQMMAAVGMELLLTTMIRRKNLADISLKKHFWPAHPTTAGSWSLAIDPKEVKNKQPLRFALSKPTIGLIEFYLKKCRPLLLKEPTDMLFLRTNGKPKGPVMMANLISRTIHRRLDLDVNVHLFRHIGTMLYLDQHPGHYGVPQVMLGHTSVNTTQQFYAHLQATKAIKHFTAAVLGARDDKITKLKLAPRSIK
jgi:integrase